MFEKFKKNTVANNSTFRSSIFREKNAAKEVKSGLECGITFKNFLDFKEKDMIESYKVDMIERQIND